MKIIWHRISIQTLLFQACLPTCQNGVENRDKAYFRGEGERRHKFAKWHVAWPAAWHDYAKYDTCGMTQRNKLTEECVSFWRNFNMSISFFDVAENATDGLIRKYKPAAGIEHVWSMVWKKWRNRWILFTVLTFKEIWVHVPILGPFLHLSQ